MSQECKIEVINREGWRKDYPVQKGIIYIGSGPTNDIVLETLHGGGVALLHAQLIANQSGYKLINLSDVDIMLGSSGGETAVAPRTAIDVLDGQSFRLGDFVLVFRGKAKSGHTGSTTNGRGSQSVGASLVIPETQLEPYQSLQGRVIVSNLGTATARFEVTLEGLDEGCYDIAPGPLLSSGAEDGVLFRIHHRGVKPLAGEWNIVFRVTAPKAYPGEKAVLAQRIQVLPLYRHRLSLLPPGSAQPPPPPEDLVTPKAVDIPLPQANSGNNQREISTSDNDVWSAPVEDESTKPLPPPPPIRLEAKPTRPVRVRPAEPPPVQPHAPSSVEEAATAESGGDWGWEAKDEVEIATAAAPVIVGEGDGDWGWEDEGQPAQDQPDLTTSASPSIENEAEVDEQESITNQTEAESWGLETPPIDSEQKKTIANDSPTLEVATTSHVDEVEPVVSQELPQPEPNVPPAIISTDTGAAEVSEPPDKTETPAPPPTDADKPALPSESQSALEEEILSPPETPVVSPGSPEAHVESETADEVSEADSKLPVSNKAVVEDVDKETAVQPESAPRWWQRWRQWLPFRRQTAADSTVTEPVALEEPSPSQEDVVESESIPVLAPEPQVEPAIQAETTNIPEETAHPVTSTVDSPTLLEEALQHEVGTVQTDESLSSSVELAEEPVFSPTAAEVFHQPDEVPSVFPVEAKSDVEPDQGVANFDLEATPLAGTTDTELEPVSSTDIEQESKKQEKADVEPPIEQSDIDDLVETDKVEQSDDDADEWGTTEFEEASPVETEQVLKVKADKSSSSEAPAAAETDELPSEEAEDWWDFEVDTPIETEQEVIKIKAQTPAKPVERKKEVVETEDWWSAD